MVETTKTNPVSASFIRARRNATPLSDFPGALPSSLADAYCIQDESIRHWPDEVAGWKVGGIPSSFIDEFGEKRLAGPIFKSSIARFTGAPVQMPVYKGGFAAVEGEIIMRLGQTIRPGAIDPGSDQVASFVSNVFLGVEIASSPLAAINDLGPLSIISDFGNNAGLIIGEEMGNWEGGSVAGQLMRVAINGNEVGATKVAALEDGALGAVRFLIGKCAERDITLDAGTYVSTGAVTGVHEAQAGDTAQVALNGAAQISLTLKPATAHG